jgi:hypothetical protein
VTRAALVLALTALLAACGGEEAAEPSERMELELVVQTGPEPPARFEVRCAPTGGTTPDPEATCAALAEHPEMLAPPALASTCPGSLGDPPQVRVVGTAGASKVDVSVRECDEPAARAESARLWLETAGLGG